MKILFLAPRLPLPADTGGKIRTLNILKQLAKNAQVTLLTFSFDKEDGNYTLDLGQLGIHVHMVPGYEPSNVEKIFKIIFQWIPFSIAKYQSALMAEKINQLLKENTFDAIHVDHLHMAHYIKQSQGLPCLLDEHNVEYKILERYIPVESSFFKKIIFWDQSLKMKTFETRLVKASKVCLACSKEDQTILEMLCQNKTPIHVIPNGVDTTFFKPNKISTDPLENAMVFTGSMDWLPNDDAITYFCNGILPLIWQKNPDIKLYVVGKNPSVSIKALAKKDSRVIVTGRVDDVRLYMNRCKVFIVPLRVGGGTRLKILEAMAMGKAVVSTTIGAEGIRYTENQNILLGDSPQIFADKVIYALNDPSKSQYIGENARKLVCAEYDWNIIGYRLKEIYQEAIGA